MAVSFNVPKSPKKDIFVIDKFMGVDLTNTGANVDEVRSPNAENMIRYVPGKVRKRMGYSVPVEFSEGTNVNRALETAGDWVELPVDGSATYIYIAQDNGEYPKIFSDHIAIQAVGTFQLRFEKGDGTGFMYWERTGTEENPYNNYFWGVDVDYTAYGGIKWISIVNMSQGPNDYLRVKDVCIFRKTTATSAAEIHKLWRPAPEDKGNAFILTSTTEPIYGKHTLKTGKPQGDFVTNVNRALRTSDTYRTYSDQIICELGEPVPKGKTIHVAFDYNIPAGSPYTYSSIYAGYDPVYNFFIHQIASVSGSGHFEADYTTVHDTVYFSCDSNTTEIKNFKVTYASDTGDTWSKAPEDDGAVFNIGNVYQKTGDNTSIVDNATSQGLHGANQSPSDTFNIPYINFQQSTTAVTGKLTIIEFDMSIEAKEWIAQSTSQNLVVSKYTMFYSNSGNGIEPMYFETGSPDNTHYTLYLRPAAGIYIDRLSFEVKVTTTMTHFAECTVSISNLKVHEGLELSDFFSSAYINLYHVGRKLYANKSGTNEFDLIYGGMNQQRSVSWQFEAHDNSSASLGYDNLYIVDGNTYLEYNGASETVAPVYGNGRIPLITYAKSPSGGGQSYYAVNRLQPGFEEQFIGDGNATAYQLSFENLDSTPVRVWVKDQNDGGWVELAEGTDFSVMYGQGIVNFTTAPWDATTQGEDNVRIRAFRTVSRYEDSINKCSFGTLFGVGGTSDRLFLSGNPDTPSYDYYSEQYDPTYFPDLNYAALGVSSSAIKGYARVNNYLATFKDENEPSQSVFIREGDLVANSQTNLSEPSFKLINTLQGNGAISPYTFGYLQTEPLFLTKSGIYAITSQDITGEKYGQSRSFYLNGSLLKEVNLETACSVVYNDQYILALNSHLYVLDGLQPVRTDPQEPYATRQYVGFYCTNVPANVMWTYQDALWFGTTNGKVCKFYTDMEDLESYNDDGEAIYSCWETPDLDGKLFYKNKTFRYFAIRMMKALRTSVKMYYQKQGNWAPDPIKEDTSSGIVFDFNNIDFTLFSFRTDRSEKVVHTKVRVKKVDKARFKVENGKLNEPFGLFDLALEYIESGNYKG